MPRSVGRLAVERMTVDALWKRSYSLLWDIRWLNCQTVKEQDQRIHQLHQVLDEIYLRGEQLALPLENHGD